MIALLGRLARAMRAALERRILGLSADEIRYTIDDVRAEIRATRAELLEEIAKLRSELDRLGGQAAADDAARVEGSARDNLLQQ